MKSESKKVKDPNMEDNSRKSETNLVAMYQIKVHGRIDESLADWFEGLEITVERGNEGQPVSTLTGMISDQAALQGILSTIGTLNLKLISVTQIESNSDQ